MALITGAARGIGQAIAELFSVEGAQVILSDINDEIGQEVANKVGVNSKYIHLDQVLSGFLLLQHMPQAKPQYETIQNQ
ncbi:MAG: SDR family NAD(P)-dependent oxidoreductase [Gammaproteobacteria bacterium]|nr:SDR family NAD(P)-dependent oxidoreductase [Gammaproteobacteria bacterium]